MFEAKDIKGLKELKAREGSLSVYLSHEPWDERHARQIAKELEAEGIKLTLPRLKAWECQSKAVCHH